MKLKFDAKQDYQLDAICAVLDLFVGQSDASQNEVTLVDEEFSSLKLTETGVANHRVITDTQWLDNLKAVQRANGLPESDALEVMVARNRWRGPAASSARTAAKNRLPSKTILVYS